MSRSVSLPIAITVLALVYGILFTPAAAAGPVITQMIPTSAPVGGELSISGSGFGATQGSSTVTVNGTLVTVISLWSNNDIEAEIPIGATTGNVVVKVGGVNSGGRSLTVVPAPAITSISPSSGPIGTPVTITGTNLLPFPSAVRTAVCFSLQAVHVKLRQILLRQPIQPTRLRCQQMPSRAKFR